MRNTKVTNTEASELWNFVTDISIKSTNNQLKDEEFKLATQEFKGKLNSLINAKIYKSTHNQSMADY
jgi:hypothetical protein